MTGSEWIGLAAVVVAGLLVLLLAVPLIRLGRFLAEATATMRWVREQPAPAAAPVAPADAVPEPDEEPAEPVTVAEPVDVPTPHVVGEQAPLSSVVAATLGGPLIKVASLSYGVRTAARTRQESRAQAAAARRRREARRATRRAA